MKKFLASFQSAVYDAVRATGQVTSDGASECAEAAEACLMQALSTDSEAIEIIQSLNVLLSAFNEEGHINGGGRCSAATAKARRTAVRKIRAALVTLGETTARNRVFAIRQELEHINESIQSLTSANSRGLLEDAAFARSKILHKKRVESLKNERNELYVKFPQISDMSKAD